VDSGTHEKKTHVIFKAYLFYKETCSEQLVNYKTIKLPSKATDNYSLRFILVVAETTEHTHLNVYRYMRVTDTDMELREYNMTKGK
jgi:hypothetical protein